MQDFFEFSKLMFEADFLLKNNENFDFKLIVKRKNILFPSQKISKW